MIILGRGCINYLCEIKKRLALKIRLSYSVAFGRVFIACCRQGWKNFFAVSQSLKFCCMIDCCSLFWPRNDSLYMCSRTLEIIVFYSETSKHEFSTALWRKNLTFFRENCSNHATRFQSRSLFGETWVSEKLYGIEKTEIWLPVRMCCAIFYSRNCENFSKLVVSWRSKTEKRIYILFY